MNYLPTLTIKDDQATPSGTAEMAELVQVLVDEELSVAVPRFLAKLSQQFAFGPVVDEFDNYLASNT